MIAVFEPPQEKTQSNGARKASYLTMGLSDSADVKKSQAVLVIKKRFITLLFRSTVLIPTSSHPFFAMIHWFRTAIVFLPWIVSSQLIALHGSEAPLQVECPSGLMCELLAAPEQTVIYNPRPKFSWIVPAAHGDGMQTAYQILVAATDVMMEKAAGDLWDSGKVESNRSVSVVYAGKPLESNRSYCWKVRVWTDEKTPSRWSEPQQFKTGRLGNNPDLARSTTARYRLVENDVPPERIVRKGPERFFIDFGKAAYGTVKLTVTSPETGRNVTIHLGEKTSANDTVDRKPGASVCYQAVPLELKAGTHTYRIPIMSSLVGSRQWPIPMPEYIGEVMPFRYCEIEGLPGDLDASSIVQVRVHYPFDDRASNFHSSNNVLNDVWELCQYTMQATSFCGVYVDGNRERRPYEADAYINQLGHYCTDREFTLARFSHEYLIVHPTWPTEWSMHSVMMAWEDYMYTADVSSLVEYYDDLKAKTLYRLARSDGLISTVEPPMSKDVQKSIHNGPLKDIVDWPKGERDGCEMRPINTVVNAFYYRALVLMGRIAKALNKHNDAEFFDHCAKQVYLTFNAILFDSQTGLYIDGEGSRHASLHANLFPLAFGLVPPERQDRVARFVASRGMACSVYGAQYLLEALYGSGQSEAALKLLTSTSDRSWAHMIYDVETTMTLEAWDTKYKPNQDWNHAWGAAPANIIPRKLMGIEPLEPGFRKVRIRPQPGGLEQASITLPTIRGPIHADFKSSKDSFLLNVQLPGNTSAEVDLPVLGDGDMVLTVDGLSHRHQTKGQFVVFDDIGPGMHCIQLRKKQ